MNIDARSKFILGDAVYYREWRPTRLLYIFLFAVIMMHRVCQGIWKLSNKRLLLLSFYSKHFGILVIFNISNWKYAKKNSLRWIEFIQINSKSSKMMQNIAKSIQISPKMLRINQIYFQVIFGWPWWRVCCTCLNQPSLAA